MCHLTVALSATSYEEVGFEWRALESGEMA